MKQCTGCGRNLPLTAFYVNNARPDGHTTQCRGCIKAKRIDRYNRNKEAEQLSRRRHIGRYRWYQRNYHARRRFQFRVLQLLYFVSSVTARSENNLYDWEHSNH